MTFAELAVCLNCNGPGAAEKMYQRAVKKLREHLYAGEYGVWVRVKRMIRKAKCDAPVDSCYSSPQVTWVDLRDL